MEKMESDPYDVAMAIVKAKLRIGYTAEAASAFKFYAMIKEKINIAGLTISHITDDIQSLNERAMRGDLDAGVVSSLAYFHAANKYLLMKGGGTICDEIGPVLASKNFRYAKELKGKRIASPGKLTTSYMTLKFHESDFEPMFCSPSEMISKLEDGGADAAVLTHGKQNEIEQKGLVRIIDLAEWFYEVTRLPLVVGVPLVKSSLQPDVMRKVHRVFRESVYYGLKHRDEALDFAMKYARGQTLEQVDQLIDIYVNDYALDMGKKGKDCLQFMCKTAKNVGMIKTAHPIKFLSS